MKKLKQQNKILLLTKKFSFDAAHMLPNHSGKCKNLHGHTYLLEVTLKGNINKNTGMIIDFDDLKKIIDEEIIKRLDHNYLNNILEIPTAENIIFWIWEMLSYRLKEYKTIKLYELKLWETPSSFVTCRAL